ncbi:hypothetical protein AAG570_004253 [Ranatra chinensis]|uniref:Nucleic-acid-binding protein from transposon X-element n=1 Tax=Ranatra chinensis TaxID=642074 RepID=A0ABD0Y5J2_9HEMI
MSEVNVYSSTEESSVCLSERLYSGEGRTVKKIKKTLKAKKSRRLTPSPEQDSSAGYTPGRRHKTPQYDGNEVITNSHHSHQHLLYHHNHHRHCHSPDNLHTEAIISGNHGCHLPAERRIITEATAYTHTGGRARMHEVMLTPSTPDAYRSIIRYLTEGKYAFHTYQIKSERAYRVVLRGLHRHVPLHEITRDIEEQGHKEPHKRSDVVQCTRCQQFRHTKSYCNHPPRCVRCAGEHDSTTCLKRRETPATCALCSRDHPANYRGCQVYKDLQNAASKRTYTQEKRSVDPPPMRASAAVAGSSCPATVPGVAATPSRPHQ